MSIDRHPITPLETKIIEWARKNDTLSDHCDLIDYYKETGAVPEHWRVKWSIMGVVKAFAQAKPEQAAQPIKWVPCAQKMPPPDGKYLVWFGGDCIGIAHTFTKWKHPSHPLGYLIQGHSGSHNDVTHWMPIPAAPQPKD